MHQRRRERAGAPAQPGPAVPGELRPADRTPTAFEQLILDGILDDRLPGLIDAINQRLRTLDEAETAAARRRLRVEDRVRLDDRVTPQYLRGRLGTIHDIDDDYIVVCLDNPVGKFTSGHVRCNPRNLEPLGPEDQQAQSTTRR